MTRDLASFDAAGLRASLDQRLLAAASATGTDVNRLRRHLVFHRMLARFTVDGGWVLKGGFALEVRLADRARATRDVDVSVLEPGSVQGVTEAVRNALALDLADHFRFDITRASPDRDDPHTAARFTVVARMAGREFGTVKLDVGTHPAEHSGALEPLAVAPPVTGLPFDPLVVTAVDVAQHAAEKYHALGRVYRGGRPSSRSKDLIDLVLMLDAGLLPHPRLGERLRHVHRIRDAVPPAERLPEPPLAWVRDFEAARDSLHLTPPDLDAAFSAIHETYRSALTRLPEDA